jgi:hypothetical protein
LGAPWARALILGDAVTHWLYPILRKTHKKEALHGAKVLGGSNFRPMALILKASIIYLEAPNK